MSTTISPQDQAPQVQPTPARRRRGSSPGMSLVAQGESMIWLTGGALIFCVAMILGLLGLIVYSGALTFWPVPLVRVELLDGAAELGEVTRTEVYDITPEKLNTLSGKAAEAAKTLLGDKTSHSSSRRLFRTENFDITQTHYRWVDDFEIKPDSEKLPKWAMVVERVRSGRFYGEPQELVVSQPRELLTHEQDLIAISQLLEINLHLFQAEEKERAEEVLKQYKEDLAKVRRENIQQFLQDVKSQDSKLADRVEVVYDDNSTALLADTATEKNVLAAHFVWASPASSWKKYQDFHEKVRARFHERENLEKIDLGDINTTINDARLDIRRIELDQRVPLLEKADELVAQDVQVLAIATELADKTRLLDKFHSLLKPEQRVASPLEKIKNSLISEAELQQVEPAKRVKEIQASISHLSELNRKVIQDFIEVNRQATKHREEIQRHILRLNSENERIEWHLKTAADQSASLRLADIVLAYPANQLSLTDKLGIYATRWHEFLFDEPREANSEGGIFPAIFGTVVMTLFMSIAVAPFGVLAALYLREYAKAGAITSAVRIAINNLAGIPSIVFGVFGMVCFCYMLGSYIDGGPENARFNVWSEKSWLTGAGVLAAIAALAFYFGMTGAPRGREDSPMLRRLRSAAILLWIVATLLFVMLVFVTPYFHGFFRAKLPDPTYGKGCLIWSSLTLALLTVPVVIVATEEALSAVPNSMREGSYACGAGKWQTIRRIVLPQAAPGIMTGMILAMARGAGEVAPLMLVGAKKLAPELPFDGTYPFVHFDRPFMHLGFHIYDLGFQSPNSEAAKPMVFTTTLLLIVLIASLNVTAIWLRARLRKRFKTGQF